MHFTKCDSIAFAFFILVSWLEAWVVFTTFGGNSEPASRLLLFTVFVTLFNCAVVWFALKYEDIKTKLEELHKINKESSKDKT